MRTRYGRRQRAQVAAGWHHTSVVRSQYTGLRRWPAARRRGRGDGSRSRAAASPEAFDLPAGPLADRARQAFAAATGLTRRRRRGALIARVHVAWCDRDRSPSRARCARLLAKAPTLTLPLVPTPDTVADRRSAVRSSSRRSRRTAAATGQPEVHRAAARHPADDHRRFRATVIEAAGRDDAARRAAQRHRHHLPGRRGRRARPATS